MQKPAELYSFLSGLRTQSCLERVMPIGTFANLFRIDITIFYCSADCQVVSIGLKIY